MSEPRIPFSYREEQIVVRLGRGWTYKRIAQDLRGPNGPLAISTVARYAQEAAEKLPNPDNLEPQMLVALWQAHRAWEQSKDQRNTAA